MPDNADSFLPPIPTITPANTPYVLCSSCAAAPVTLIEQWLVPVAICVALAEANSDDSAGALRGNTTVLHETDGLTTITPRTRITAHWHTLRKQGTDRKTNFRSNSTHSKIAESGFTPSSAKARVPLLLVPPWAPTWMVPNRRTALTATTPLLPQRTTVVVLLVRSWTVRWTPCWDSIRPHS